MQVLLTPFSNEKVEGKSLSILSKFKFYDTKALILSAILLSSFLVFVCVCVCVEPRVGFLFCYLFLARVNLNCRPYESQRITMRMLNIPKLSKLNRTLKANSSWVQAQILSFTDPETQFLQCWQNSQVLGDCFTLTTLSKDSHKQRSNLLITAGSTGIMHIGHLLRAFPLHGHMSQRTKLQMRGV